MFIFLNLKWSDEKNIQACDPYRELWSGHIMSSFIHYNLKIPSRCFLRLTQHQFKNLWISKSVDFYWTQYISFTVGALADLVHASHLPVKNWTTSDLWCQKLCSWDRLSKSWPSELAHTRTHAHTSFCTVKLKHPSAGTRRQNFALGTLLQIHFERITFARVQKTQTNSLRVPAGVWHYKQDHISSECMQQKCKASSRAFKFSFISF